MKNTQLLTRHPGKLLEKFIQGRGLSQKQFADLIGKSQTDVSLILSGDKSINLDYAMRISIVFGTSPEVWLGMQQAYDVYQLQVKPNKHESEYEEIRERVANFSYA